MGFWLYFVFPLIISLGAIILARFRKLHRFNTLLKVISIVFLLISLAFAGYVVFIGIQTNSSGLSNLYLAMLVILIAYIGIVFSLKRFK